MEKIIDKYNTYLEKALATIFRSKEENGFWDETNGRIIKRLMQSRDVSWAIDESFDLRYGPFGLMGVLYWRYRNQDAHSNYDAKIKRYLDYLINKVNAIEIKNHSQYSGINYGILASLSIGYLLFKDERYLNKAIGIFDFNRKYFKKIRHNILSLIIWGECWLYEALADDESRRELREEIKKQIRKRSEWFIACQDEKGYFETGDLLAIQFARTMYTLWSLSRAIKILGAQDWLKNIEKTLDYTLMKQKADDGAFLWHPKFYFTKFPIIPFKIPIYYPSGAEWLFECHQTFFINAVEQYKEAGGSKDYLQEEIDAIEWIFGKNRMNKDLAEFSGIGVPIRLMNFESKIYIKPQNFKGTYEIGSYIMALSDLVIRLTNITNEKRK